MNPHIFRAYDIRGVAATDLNPEVAFAVGRALGTLARRRGASTFAVGRDCRLSGPRVKADVVRGLQAAGLDVFDVGMVPTPMLYFAAVHRGYGGGIQITGSHNPPEFNGFKMMIGPETLHGDEIQTLREIIEANDFETGEGRVQEAPIEEEYLDWVVDNIQMGPRKLKLVVDAGNGVAGPSAVRLFERLGMEVIGKFIEPDGTFPNHHPDPTTVEVAEIMGAQVKAEGADLAIGFDGDGDRIGVVDEKGDVQWGDRLMILFSRAVLAAVPGATIVSEVKCSQTLYDDIAAHGGNGIMWRTGHSPIKAKMRETGAELGGEMSGHIFFKHRFFGFDDASYAAARLLEILSHDTRTVSEMFADIPTTFVTPEIRLECPDEIKFDVVARIVARLKADHEVFDIDGARVNFPDGWGLIRASNTQPVLVLRAEARTAARRDEIREMLSALVAEESAKTQ